MKGHFEFECSPEEARRFLGLPDVSRANDLYVDSLVNAMKGTGNIEQLQDMMKQFAPMGELGLKMFRQMMENSANAAFGKSSSRKD
ncbi:DUF6489 family protein [Croceicoccus sp. YJ47]|uniref:DUF6489 family protein n=1 Tax=Croceicoccus sp. YJ47 TaxID=2798724 RepID=UPI0019227242|nr:DUF6489 family protein [Croceicoccus sp. YJ47]QQN75436.1 hypothetical protein JD971_07355 [Croceicoccus sp. YJ47]